MRHLLAAALLLAACDALAGWCGPDLVFFHAGGHPETCRADLVPLQEQSIEVHLVAYDLPGPLSELQFRAENWLSPGEPPQGEIAEMWAADAVAGDLATGITLTWNEGLAPFHTNFDGSQSFRLGTISLLPYTADWAGTNHQVRLRDLSYRNLEGQEFVGDELEHSLFTLNADSESECIDFIVDPPFLNYCSWTLMSPPDGGTVSGDFVFRGKLAYFSCWNYWPYPVRATVKLNGMQIGVHEDEILLELEQLVSVSGIGDGESFTITVETDAGWPCQPSYTYTYTLDTTATGRESFSAIKACY